MLFTGIFLLVGYYFYSILGIFILGTILLSMMAWISAKQGDNLLIPAMVWNLGLGILSLGFYLLLTKIMTVSQSPKPVFIFDEFFDLGLEETSSPFITSDSRFWGANLTLKAALFASDSLPFLFPLLLSTTHSPLLCTPYRCLFYCRDPCIDRIP